MVSSLNNNQKIGTAFFVLSLFLSMCSQSQNLVINPSFEEYSVCPNSEGQFIGFVDEWETYFSSPDYINSCDFYPTWLSTDALIGNGMVNSVFSHHQASRREYLHGRLKEPLNSGEMYYVEYYVHQFDFGIATDEYHAHLTDRVIDDNPADGVLGIEPHIQYDGGIIVADSGWTAVSGCYMADGGENRIVLGNFFSDAQTSFIELTPGTSNFSLVDQVGVFNLVDLSDRPDTILYQGDTLPFPRTDPRKYFIPGEGKLSDFVAVDTGCYTVHYRLNSCDLLDSFEICVLACPEDMDVDLFGNAQQVTCYEQGEQIELEVADSLEIMINGELVTDLDAWQPIRGVNQIQITDPLCDLMDDYTLIYAECCDEWSTDSIDCPVDTTTCQVYVPNAFSPNNDGINDDFVTFSNCDLSQFYLKIFNRYGAKVFESRDQNIGWDGMFRSKPIGTGIYVYVLEYTEQEIKQIKSGDILLIR